MTNTPRKGWIGRPQEAPLPLSTPISPLSHPYLRPLTPGATEEACGCDSVSSCLTPSAVLTVLLIDLLRADTNCRLLLDLFLGGILFQQPANFWGLLKLSFPG